MPGHPWLCISSDSLKYQAPLSEDLLLHYILISNSERVKGPEQSRMRSLSHCTNTGQGALCRFLQMDVSPCFQFSPVVAHVLNLYC